MPEHALPPSPKPSPEGEVGTPSGRLTPVTYHPLRGEASSSTAAASAYRSVVAQ